VTVLSLLSTDGADGVDRHEAARRLARVGRRMLAEGFLLAAGVLTAVWVHPFQAMYCRSA
jgi:hypothetical protein